MRLPLTPGPARYLRAGGSRVRLTDDAKKSVLFLGFADAQDPDFGIHCVGTGFLISHDGYGYLATARHVAATLDNIGWVIRANRTDGGCQNIEVEAADWAYHPDPNIDVAVMNFAHHNLQPKLDVLFLPSDTFLTVERLERFGVGDGDPCHTVGLFRVLHGKKRNVPVAHTGNIALFPGEEKIPIIDWDDETRTRFVDAYLIESQSLPGLSGSPVFVRPTFMMDVMFTSHVDGTQEKGSGLVTRNNLFLLGLFQAAWHAPPSEIIFPSRGKPVVVPVGMGVVVPADRIVEILNLPRFQALRDEGRRRKAQQFATTPLSTVALPAKGATEESAPPAIEGDERHAERFAALLGAALGKPKQGD